MGKRYDSYKTGLLKGAFGLLLILFSLLVALSPSTHLSFFCYPLVAMLGYIGHYSFILLCFYMGLRFLFACKLPRLGKRISLGLIPLLLGAMILGSDLGNEGNEALSSFSFYCSCINDSFSSPGFAFLSNPSLTGGILGYACSASLNLLGRYLVIIVSVILLLFALLVIFFPLIKKAYLALRAKEAVRKARAGGNKRSKESDDLEVGEVDPGFAFHELDRPSSSEEEKEAILEEERKAMERWDFRPSSSLSFSSRVSRSSCGEESAPSPSLDETPIRQGKIDTYYRGDTLQEPRFDFSSARESKGESEEEVAITPAAEALFPSSPISSETAGADIASETTEEEKEQEVQTEEQPSSPFVALTTELEPSFPLPSPQEDEPKDEEEEEAKANEAPIAPSFGNVKEEAPSPVPAPSPVEEAIKNEKKEEPVSSEDAPALPLPDYVFPDESLLDEPLVDEEAMEEANEEATKNMVLMNEALASLKAGASVISFKIGPSVTRYDVKMDPGVQVNTLFRYETDISACLAGLSARFVPIVKDKTTSSFEIGNRKRMPVAFKEVFSALPEGDKYNMVVPFGKSIDGEVVYGDLSSFPHMLVAGTTGSGKSIFLHNMLLSLLMRNRPEDLRLLVVDPKQVEFTVYDELPNLLCPAITSPGQAKVALDKLAEIMDKRFEMLRKAKVRDIRGYNSVYAPMNKRKKLPFIVVVIDEFAELAIQCKDIAEPIQRLGQKGRACGIHMIVATQRPDAQTISGTIKANLPVTVCLMVKNAIDSNVVLHSKGGESLLNHGDMLVDCPSLGREFVRCQSAMVGEQTELLKIPSFIRNQLPPNYDPFFSNLEPDQQLGAASLVEAPTAAMEKATSDEEKYQMIKGVIMGQETTSISQVQRTFGVGFPKAGRIIARLQKEGIVALTSDAPGSSKGFRVLKHVDSDDGAIENGDTPGSLSSATSSYSEE